VLKKKNRISKRSEFEEIKKGGKMLGFSRFFGVVVMDKKDEELKFGVVTSKKISKKAVERNKIKRRLMAVLGKNLSRFNKGTRVLFLSKKEVLKAKISDFDQEIERLCLKK
jgi:ribonuclease P protein component